MRDHLKPILDPARPASPPWFTEENLQYWLSIQSPPKFGSSLTCSTPLNKPYTLITQRVRSPLLWRRLPDLCPAPGGCSGHLGSGYLLAPPFHLEVVWQDFTWFPLDITHKILLHTWPSQAYILLITVTSAENKNPGQAKHSLSKGGDRWTWGQTQLLFALGSEVIKMWFGAANQHPTHHEGKLASELRKGRGSVSGTWCLHIFWMNKSMWQGPFRSAGM